MNHRFIAALLLGAATVALGPVACTTTASEPAATPLSDSELGIRTDWMDTSADPGDDFVRYANGEWYDRTEIPADRSNVGGFYLPPEKRVKVW